ncbi:MAG: CapA family protein [Gemmatimonadaceae bacterium]
MSQSVFRVIAVGDLQLGDSPTCVGFGFASRYGPDALLDVLDDVTPTLAGADLVFGNLEVPLSTRGRRSGSLSSLQLRGDPEYASALRAAGFTVLNVANNHAVQHGVEVFHDSVNAVQRAGIAVCGVRGSAPWSSAPVTISSAGRRVGMLGYCLRPRQYGQEAPPYAEGTPEGMRSDIERLRSESDAVVVSLHWGEEFVSIPSTDEAQLARSLVDAGASVILGHHPHVVRPVEAYGDGLIAYSLGNLVGDMIWYPPFRTGAILSVTLDGPVARDAVVRGTSLRSDYRPQLTGIQTSAVPSGDLPVLEPGPYARAIRDTWRRQRGAAYWYTVSRPWRFPPRILAQLVARTLRNKLAGLVGGATDEPGAS